MAIAFARVSIHSRSQGHSAVAGAAYRTGTQLFDERTGETHDFKNRSDVKHSEILLPDGADSKFQNHEYLWNAVEASEKRKDAQVAKDIVLALPRGLHLSQQAEIARHFAQYHFVSKGLVADIAIHDKEEGNPHAHIYLSTRRLIGDRFDRYKARDLNPSFSNGSGKKGFISEQDHWGEEWRHFQNTYFEEHDLNLFVDENHLFAERHEGRVRGKGSHYLQEENQLNKVQATEIALHDPESLLNILGTRHAVFSERQLNSLLFKCTTSTEQFQTAAAAIKAHRDVICLGVGSDGILRYTTRANFRAESRLGEQAEILSKRQSNSLSSTSLQRLSSEYSLRPEQDRALQHIFSGSAMTIVVGHAGTGKSYLMKAAHAAWQKKNVSVRGISVAGVAAKNLQRDSGIPSSTIASFKRRLLKNPDYLKHGDVIVMDEAGMTDLHDMAFVVNAIKKKQAKLVLVGDPEQLQPVGAGAPFRALVETVGFVVATLEDISRQHDPLDQKASHALALGDVESALSHYENKGAIHWHQTPQEAMHTLVDRWAETLSTTPLSETLILAHRNRDISRLNLLAREKCLGVNKGGQTVEIVKRITLPGGWEMRFGRENITLAAGDRILFRRNDRPLNIMNGDFGTVVSIKGQELEVMLDDQRKLNFNTKHYNEFDYGYAVTVHKSQGATKENTFVYAGGWGWTRHLAYVGLTRHRQNVELHVDRETFASEKQMLATFSRRETKDRVLDWPLAFATRRGFDPESLIERFIEKCGQIKTAIKDQWDFIANYSKMKKDPEFKQGFEFGNSERGNTIKKEIQEPLHILEKSSNPAEISASNEDAHSITPIEKLPLQELLVRYVDMELKQNRLVQMVRKADHTAQDSDEKFMAPMIAHSAKIRAFSADALKHADVKTEIDSAMKMRAVNMEKSVDFNAIRESLHQGKLSSPDKQAVLSKLQERALDYEQEQIELKKNLSQSKTIDWRSPKYEKEFENLRKNPDETVQLLTRLHAQLRNEKDPYEIELTSKIMTDLTIKISQTSGLNSIKHLAPKLSQAIKNVVKNKEKSMDRDR